MFRVFINKGTLVVNHSSRLSKLSHSWQLSLRPFTARSGRQSSSGLNSTNRGNDYENRLSEFYRDSKMQRLWDDTYERISAFQTDRQVSASNQGSAPSVSLGTNDKRTTSYGLNEGSANVPHEVVDTANYSNAISANKQTRPNARHMFSLDEQQIMKLSFAEGYFYGQEGKRKSRYTVVTFIRDVMILTVITGLIFSGVNVETAIKPGLWGSGSFEVAPEEIEARFADVKGCDESKQELVDVVEFLRKPSKFTRLGGKLPKGVLLIGPPGTGKTLLARAVAGEAGVPFFQAVGSEFDEILVGQGARRVRELFNKAKQQAPCVIFIDEMDSIGGKRASTAFHPNANQTVNQLLSEMDGFKQNEGIIVVGATNRLNDLDRALLRPGRFDVQVNVPIPDYKGRRELFEFYLSKVRAAVDIDIDTLCRSTVGLTGADIKNIVNQAALKSATENAEYITQEALEYARDKLLMGPERRSQIPDKEQNSMTAYHEGGHTLVAFYTEKANKLHKVTIVSRGSSLGHTSVLPERDMYSQTREQLSATLDVLLGGRVAEEIVYGSDRVTTGCSDDLRKANMIATQMVKDFGMSEKVGMRVVREEDSQSQIVVNNFSDATSELVESEISRLLDESKERVRKILTEHRNELTLLAEALIKYETLDAAEVKLVIEGKDPKASRQEKERDRRTKLSKVPFDRRPFGLLK